MGAVRDLSEALLRGERSTAELNPLVQMMGLEEYGPGLAFVSAFGNVTAVDTQDGLVLIDTGSFFTGGSIHAQIRDWRAKPVHTAVYTHGHADHAGGIAAIEQANGTSIRVVGHEAVAARFDRYKRTLGYNSIINMRQFRVPGLKWPEDWRYPDETYRSELSLEVGGERFELRHDRGETDDHTWVWMPDRKVLCCGDLFIWASPNCGNPQKVQRYPKEWARALRAMADLAPEVLCPGHGPPIEGADRIRQALGDVATLLEVLHDGTVERMNAGMPLNAILHEVKAPADLLERPWLRPVYDDPEFIVRNVWRLYGGWYDGNPAHLKPARDDALAAEVAALGGGAPRLAERALELLDAGDLRLASHLAEWALRAAPDDGTVQAACKAVYGARAEAEPSLMAKSIFAEAGRGERS
jgi:glyoxylase-like metal-dependent hydrolase (beta-lactamase superfamily II)